MTMEHRVLATTVLGFLLAAATANSVWADSGSNIDTGFGKGTATIGGTHAGSNVRGGGGGKAAPARAVVMVPDCGNNSPGAGQDVACPDAGQRCAARGEKGMMLRVFQGPPGVESPAAGQWTLIGRKCADPNALGVGNVFPGVSESQLRQLPIKPQTPIIQPPGGKTLINVRTNTYVVPKSQTIPTSVIGIPVLVRVHPASFTWTYGDGGTLTTEDPGAAYPDLRTTHTYAMSGEYTITLSTTYVGEYSLDNGASWAGIDGTATVASAALPITVMQVHTQLVTGEG